MQSRYRIFPMHPFIANPVPHIIPDNHWCAFGQFAFSRMLYINEIINIQSCFWLLSLSTRFSKNMRCERAAPFSARLLFWRLSAQDSCLCTTRSTGPPSPVPPACRNSLVPANQSSATALSFCLGGFWFRDNPTDGSTPNVWTCVL